MPASTAPDSAPAVPAAPAVQPFRLFSVEVVRKEWLTPGMVRVTFGGADLEGFVNGGRDQRIKLLLPLEGQTEPVLPDDDVEGGWYRGWQRMPEIWRPVMRTYTVRAQRPEAAEVDVDLALHSGPAEGPASRWARATGAGDRIAVFGPTVSGAGGVEFHLPPEADEVLIAGDEAALPAIAAILETLPESFPTRVFIRITDPAHRQPLTTAAAVRIHWVDGGTGLAKAVGADDARRADAPSSRYAWIAGEASQVRTLRRYLVNDCGYPRKAVTFMGYWRKGRSEVND
ncbi:MULTISPECIES: siderophore-interacting protein [Streptacidiphilus]|uniref:Siderophore-interacting protein n=1 Tax=Streptacidiphilus cavernicola TaxID=3342716 RepID=A0ABV6UG99_9ACTN|nr:siderophore-interacting protein [Streptacidiphilus jeojiense]